MLLQEELVIDDLWYKNAIIYCLSVESFMDANGDGVGDFKGLMRRLDYLAGLGVTAVWLIPFQPSPGRDDGYDVSDYYNVDPRYGALFRVNSKEVKGGDGMTQFGRALHELNIEIICANAP
jgi:glycosidase